MSDEGHVGLVALETERSKLLSEYDAAVRQGHDDAVKTEHGVHGEAQFRSFLEQFLPRRYGVTKGYIITPSLDYSGPLEEFDIIIYDALESPVLFVRRNRDEADHAGKRGIPAEYVRAVVEVKATFNKVHATQVATKLGKLRQFQQDIGPGSRDRSARLPDTFCASAVFFETKLKDRKEYAAALDALIPLWKDHSFMQHPGGLIIRSQTDPDCSGLLNSTSFKTLDVIQKMESLYDQISQPWQDSPSGFYEAVDCMGFAQNNFWMFMISMVHSLAGEVGLDSYGWPRLVADSYGHRRSEKFSRRLFPLLEPKPGGSILREDVIYPTDV